MWPFGKTDVAEGNMGNKSMFSTRVSFSFSGQPCEPDQAVRGGDAELCAGDGRTGYGRAEGAQPVGLLLAAHTRRAAGHGERR